MGRWIGPSSTLSPYEAPIPHKTTPPPLLRIAGGLHRRIVQACGRIEGPDYSTVNRRVGRLRMCLDGGVVESDEPVIIAADSSGGRFTAQGMDQEGLEG